MYFQESENQQALRARINSFCAANCNDEQEFERDINPVYPDGLHKAMAKAGILGHCLPPPYGEGGDLVDLCIINEELAKASISATNILFINGICAAIIAAAGSEAQRDNLLPGLAAGDLRFAFALTEPNAGSDAAGIELTAINDGDAYVLNGTKLYTTGAADADFILTAARSSSEGKASRGTSIILVPTQSAGLRIRHMDKMAGNDIASCRVDYDDVRVPHENCLGGENQGWPALMIGGGLERLSVAACCLGASRAALDEVLAHVRQREQFGQAISKFQAIQHQIADMSTRIEAMRWLTYAAAWKVAQGSSAIREISMAKVFAAENAQEIMIYGMRLLGARAYMRDAPMSRRLREILLALYAGGTMEIQRNLIARDLGL